MRFFGVNFILQKFCSCKKNYKYEVWSVLHSILYSILRVQFLLGNLMICCHNVVVVHNTSFFWVQRPKVENICWGNRKQYISCAFSTSKDNCNCTMLWAISGQLQKVPVWKDSKVAAVFHSGRAISSPCVLSSKNPNQSLAYPDDPTTQVLKILMTCQPLLFWRLPIWARAVTRNNPMCEVAIEGHFNKLEGAPNSQKYHSIKG